MFWGFPLKTLKKIFQDEARGTFDMFWSPKTFSGTHLKNFGFQFFLSYLATLRQREKCNEIQNFSNVQAKMFWNPKTRQKYFELRRGVFKGIPPKQFSKHSLLPNKFNHPSGWNKDTFVPTLTASSTFLLFAKRNISFRSVFVLKVKRINTFFK